MDSRDGQTSHTAAVKFRLVSQTARLHPRHAALGASLRPVVDPCPCEHQHRSTTPAPGDDMNFAAKQHQGDRPETHPDFNSLHVSMSLASSNVPFKHYQASGSLRSTPLSYILPPLQSNSLGYLRTSAMKHKELSNGVDHPQRLLMPVSKLRGVA